MKGKNTNARAYRGPLWSQHEIASYWLRLKRNMCEHKNKTAN